VKNKTFLFLCILLISLLKNSNVYAGEDEPKEIEVNVKESRLGARQTSTSEVKISREQIDALPQGDQAGISKVVANSAPGVIAGPTGQLFFRGTYEGSVQYQIDGIELPDLPTARFGEIFPTQNIERIEVISGGFPAEYGERLGGIINVIPRSGATEHEGTVEVSYGSYDTWSPVATYSGATEDGSLHYFTSASYTQSSRGLNTPEPSSDTQIGRGGEQAIHDKSYGNNELIKLDWLVSDDNKVSFLFLNSDRLMQIPNFPGSFSPASPLFSAGDGYGNSPYRYVPSYTNDTQTENTDYLAVSWKHTFSETAFLQVTPYWKNAYIGVGSDLGNDLAGVQTGQVYSSFSQDRTINNYGLRADLTKILDSHRVKTGIFLETAGSSGSFNIVTATDNPGNQATYSQSPSLTMNQEALYLQDDYSPTPSLVINAGLRANFTQRTLSDSGQVSDLSIQPRLGSIYALTSTTQLHGYVGVLYHNAPPEDLRAAFNAVNGSASPTPYDIKSENARYYELGLNQELPHKQNLGMTLYYREATDWLDDAQLLYTYLSQPINFAFGYAEGAELQLRGPVSERIDYIFNYSYSIAQVRGMTGGLFTGEDFTTGFSNLDTSQYHTVNTSWIWHNEKWAATVQGLYGSGLPTGSNNSVMLPGHLTFDMGASYEIKKPDQRLADWKFSLDILNIFDNPYPITVANGLTGSQYSSGRQYFVRVASRF
jgi:outer membrane receptor for ferrienterochelin and colicin